MFLFCSHFQTVIPWFLFSLGDFILSPCILTNKNLNLHWKSTSATPDIWGFVLQVFFSFWLLNPVLTLTEEFNKVIDFMWRVTICLNPLTPSWRRKKGGSDSFHSDNEGESVLTGTLVSAAIHTLWFWEKFFIIIYLHKSQLCRFNYRWCTFAWHCFAHSSAKIHQ